MKDKIFLDSNVLIYAYSATEPNKKNKTLEILNEIDKLLISTQVIGEFINALYKKYKVERELITTSVGKFLNFFEISIISKVTIKKALVIFNRYKFFYYDSLIIASALENGCKVLYSEDMQHNQVIEDRLTIVNPFTSC